VTRRRELLSLLGIGTLSALSGCLGGGDGDDGNDGEASGDFEAVGPSNVHRVQRRAADLRAVPTPPTPEYSFDYGEEHFDDIDDEYIAEVHAVSGANAEGDRLRIVPQSVAPVYVAEQLRTAWHVTSSEELTATVDGESVPFVGGTAAGYAYLIGTPGGADSAVFVGRGTSMDVATEMVQTFG
jgi:hypothetical protein